MTKSKRALNENDLKDIPESEVLGDGTHVFQFGDQVQKPKRYNQEKIPIRLHPEFFMMAGLLVKKGVNKLTDEDRVKLTALEEKFSKYVGK